MDTRNQKRQRRGRVRLSGRALRDDGGGFNALGATLFWAAWAYRNDRPKLERNLRFLAEHGFDYFRALGVVGRLPYWKGREIDWRWPDYDAVIAGVTDLAYDRYGLRVQWTLIGDGDQVIPDRADRFRLADRFLALSRGREHKILLFETANEAWQNGFGGDEGLAQLRELTRYLKDRTDILVAASSVEDPKYEGDYCKAASIVYAGHIADIVTIHFPRDVRTVEGPWRPVHQPWENCGRIVANNEPIGPGSSVAQDDDPYCLVTAAAVTYLAQLPCYVYHTEAGIWGGTIRDRSGASDLTDYPLVIAKGFAALKRYLPAALANWDRQDPLNNPRHPFRIFAGGVPDKTWPEGFPDGVVRAYGTVSGSRFVVLPIGIKSFVRMEARRAVEFDVLDPLTGDVVERHRRKAGESVTLKGLPAFVLKGRYR